MDEVSCALCLIASSPNLERIKIEMSYVCNYFESLINPVEQLLEAQEYSNLSLNRLQEVNIVIFLDTRPEMDFIMFLLAKSPVLLKMEIEIIAEEEEQHGKVIQMLKEVNRFQRASSFAGIEISARSGSQFVSIKEIVGIPKVIHSRRAVYSSC